MTTKNIKIDGRTHSRLKRKAESSGRMIGFLAGELINSALDSEIKPGQSQRRLKTSTKGGSFSKN